MGGDWRIPPLPLGLPLHSLLIIFSKENSVASKGTQSKVVEMPPRYYYRTNQMALVAYLKMEGHASQRMQWEGDTCYWYFDKSDPLMDTVDDFLGGTAKVEPREYNREFGRTRKELMGSNEFIERFGSYQQQSAQ